MELVSLQSCNFRNLASETIDWSDGINLVLGGNGEGKTNLLEAVSVLGNLRSFRSNRFRRIVRHGESSFRLAAELRCGGSRRELHQVVAVGPPLRRELRVNGAPVDVDQYLSSFPVFSLGPNDRELVIGAPEIRRAFLDRFVFLLGSRYLSEHRAYRRALAQRNAALNGMAGDDELGEWERELAVLAAQIWRRRSAAVKLLAPAFVEVYKNLCGQGFPEVSVSYRSEPWLEEHTEEVEELYFQRYNGFRARDRKAGFTLDGPHRHDLVLRADGRPVRDVLSSGQSKIVAAALRLATLKQVEEVRDEVLPLIVDDVDAELDGDSLSRLVGWVGNKRQVFLSSANEESITLRVSQSSRIWMHGGSCSRKARPQEICYE